LIGGVVAAYLLHGKVGQAATAGALAGLLGTPFIFGIEQILAIFEVLPIPPGPTPSMAEQGWTSSLERLAAHFSERSITLPKNKHRPFLHLLRLELQRDRLDTVYSAALSYRRAL
jgi:hypothetical protein